MQIQKNVSAKNFGNDMVLDLGAGRREIYYMGHDISGIANFSRLLISQDS